MLREDVESMARLLSALVRQRGGSVTITALELENLNAGDCLDASHDRRGNVVLEFKQGRKQ